MIVVEGPDGGGKSTLCKYLHERTGLALSAHSRLSKAERNDPWYRSQEAVRERVYQSVLSMVAGSDAPEIHDRLLYSELIYSSVFKREPAFTYDESIHLLRCFNACRIPVFFCIPPWADIRKGIRSSDHIDGAVQNLANIYNGYVMWAKFASRKRRKGITNRDQAFDYNQPRVILYDYNKPEHKERALTIVQQYVVLRKRRSGGWYEGPAPKKMIGANTGG